MGTFDFDVVEFGIAVCFAAVFFSIMQHAVLKNEWIVHGATAFGAAMAFMYYFLLTFNIAEIENNLRFREILNRPGIVIFVIGVSLILLNGQIKAWTQRLWRSRSLSP